MKTRWIEIAKPGIFPDSNRVLYHFTKARLEKIAAQYNPAEFGEAPIVIGHPKISSPAYGWTKELKIQDDKLLANVAYVSDEFAQAVDNGYYKYCSMSLSKDDRLRHIGYLGGHPPGIKGLTPVNENLANFADEPAVTINFSEEEISQEGYQMTLEESMKQVASLQSQVNTLTQERDAALKEVSGLKEQLNKGQAAAEKTAAEFAEYQNKQELAILTGRVENLVKEAKITPAEKAGVMKTAEALRQTGTMNFSDGSSGNPLDDFLKTLEARKPSDLISNFSEPAADDNGQGVKAQAPLSAKL